MTDAKRLAEIGVRCERATEGPWRMQMDGVRLFSRVDGPSTEDIALFAREGVRTPLSYNADFIAHAREDIPWLLEQLGKADVSEPEANVIAAALQYEDMDRQYRELRSDDPWYGHYKEILLTERAIAKKNLCEAVKRLREGSGGGESARCAYREEAPRDEDHAVRLPLGRS